MTKARVVTFGGICIFISDIKNSSPAPQVFSALRIQFFTSPQSELDPTVELIVALNGPFFFFFSEEKKEWEGAFRAVQL